MNLSVCRRRKIETTEGIYGKDFMIDLRRMINLKEELYRPMKNSIIEGMRGNGVMKKRSLNRALAASILLLTGFLLLLINIGVISLEIKEMFVEVYPILLLLAGIYLFISYFSRQSGNKLFIGLFLITYSTLLLISKFTNLDFKIWNLWPLLIVFIGLQLLLSKNNRIVHKDKTEYYEDETLNTKPNEQGDYSQKIEEALIHLENGKEKLRELSGKKADEQTHGIIHQQIEDVWTEINKSQETINLLKLTGKPELRKKKSKEKSKVRYSKMITLGSVDFNQSNWHLEPMNIYHGIGDYSFDLNKAYIPERETLIQLKGWIGDVNILIPEDIPIRVQAKVTIGEVTIFSSSSAHVFGPNVYFESPQYEEAVKKIDFVIDMMIGEVKIDKV